MPLPTQRSQPSTQWIDQRLLMIGPGKCGKSAFFAQGDRTFFFDLEGGLTHLAVMKVPIRTWEEFTETCGELYKVWKAGSFPYDTLVIDTIDKLIDRAHEQIIDLAKEKYKGTIAEKIESVGDIPNGAGWYRATELVSITLDKLKQFPAALVLIGHVVTKEFEDGVRKYKRDTINIGGQMGTKLLHWADHTLQVRARMQGDEIRRCVRTKPCEGWDAGSRGNLVPDGMIWTNGSGGDAANYQAFRHLFT